MTGWRNCWKKPADSMRTESTAIITTMRVNTESTAIITMKAGRKSTAIITTMRVNTKNTGTAIMNTGLTVPAAVMTMTIITIMRMKFLQAGERKPLLSIQERKLRLPSVHWRTKRLMG